MNLFRWLKWLSLPLALALPLAAADQGQARQDDPILQEILNELRQIRQLLEKQPAAGPAQPAAQRPAKTTVVDAEGGYSLGSEDAPVTIVEFTDFQCPFCQRFHLTAFGQLKKNYIDTGKVRFVSRDLPLDIHPNAMQAAEAGRCAGEQGQFWAMRDRMQSNPDKLDMDHLVGFAQEFKMDAAQFRSCVASGKYTEAIKNEILAARGVGATATPSFVIGRSGPGGVEGELIVGAMPYAMVDQKLRALLP
jgi:protein-disulfide isomerase